MIIVFIAIIVIAATAGYSKVCFIGWNRGPLLRVSCVFFLVNPILVNNLLTQQLWSHKSVINTGPGVWNSITITLQSKQPVNFHLDQSSLNDWCNDFIDRRRCCRLSGRRAALNIVPEAELTMSTVRSQSLMKCHCEDNLCFGVVSFLSVSALMTSQAVLPANCCTARTAFFKYRHYFALNRLLDRTAPCDSYLAQLLLCLEMQQQLWCHHIPSRRHFHHWEPHM